MKPPIISDCRGDVEVFATVAAVELEMEAIDVRHGEYTVYDSEGRLLKPSVITHQGRERVVLADAEAEPRHQEQLRAVLMDFLSFVVPPGTDWSSRSLEQLIAKASEFK